MHALPHTDAFAELAARPHTEINLCKRGGALFEASRIDRPLAERTPPVRDADPLKLCRFVGRGARVVVSLDRELCLSRTVELPKPALRRAGDILDLELARVTPFARDDVHMGWIDHGPHEDGSTHAIEQVIIRKDAVAGVFDAIRLRGADPVGLVVREGSKPALRFALAADGTPFGTAAMRRWRACALAGLALLVASATALAGAVLVRQSRLLATIETETEVVARAAAAVRSQLDGIKSRSEAVAALQARKLADAELPRAIEEMSRILPDDAFVERLTVAADRLDADGSSNSPEELIAPLEASPHFKDVAFAAPVFRNPAERRSRFSIKLTLESRGGPLP